MTRVRGTADSTDPGAVRISGAPTAHEVAAVVAALHAFEAAVDQLSSYERWRRQRLAALGLARVSPRPAR